MRVSCLMLTYGRYRSPEDNDMHLLNEAVQSFACQTHKNRELIIVNDQPEQKIQCKVSGVRVYNITKRFSSIGAKRNFAMEKASGEVCCTWDDDDISLPNRCENIAKAFTADPHLEIAGCQKYICTTDNTGALLHTSGSPPGVYPGTAFRRDVGMQIKYKDLSFGEDAQFIGEFLERGGAAFYPGEIDFIYRWGMNLRHASAYGKNVDGYAVIADRTFAKAILEIEPHWSIDYTTQLCTAKPV